MNGQLHASAILIVGIVDTKWAGPVGLLLVKTAQCPKVRFQGRVLDIFPSQMFRKAFIL
jgi:hypothetical protein